MPGPEKTFENKIKAYLDEQKCWLVKFFANRMTKEGIPDILACINGYFVGIEIKAQNGKPSQLQLYHCEKIRQAGGFAFVVYPTGFERFKKFVGDLKKDTFNRGLPIVMK